MTNANVICSCPECQTTAGCQCNTPQRMDRRIVTRKTVTPHASSIAEAEIAIIEALNQRDAYAVVVARLIDWFRDKSNGSFELCDYQAIMRDADLMDEECRLVPMAMELIRKG